LAERLGYRHEFAIERLCILDEWDPGL